MDVISKRDQKRETSWLEKKRQETTRLGNVRFKFDSNVNRKMWVPRMPDKRRRVKMASIDQELLFKNNKENQRSKGY